MWRRADIGVAGRYALPVTDLPPTQRETEKPPLMARLGAAGPLAIASAVLPIIGSLVLFANADAVRDLLKAQGSLGWALFALGFCVLSGLALLPTYAQSGMAGYIFGLALGAPAAVLGCVGGSLIGYVVARAASGDRVVRVIDEHPKWRAIREALEGERHSFWRLTGTVTLLRLPPNSPFAMTNLALAATRVPLRVYLLGTAVGIAPRTVLAAYIGSGIRESFSSDAWNAAVPKWVYFGGIGLAIVVVVILGQIAAKAVEKIGRNGVTADDQASLRG